MNIAVSYYTKSGNTEKLAKAIAEKLNVPCEPVSKNLTENVDLLFLGASYYAFDMDPEVKKFIMDNKDKIKCISLFGTSAGMKSMKKPMKKVLADTEITLLEEEFHCHGSFGFMHKNKPDESDLNNVKAFAESLVKKYQ